MKIEIDITPEELGSMLFVLHEHYPNKKGKIFYYESDLLKLFEAIGIPQPVWGGQLKIEDYLKSKK